MRFGNRFVCDCVPMKYGTGLAVCHVIACRTLFLTVVFRQRHWPSAADPLSLPHVLSSGYCGRWVGCLGCSWKTHVIASAGLKPTVSVLVSIVNQADAPVSQIYLFWIHTLHVSDGLSVHQQEFKTVHTATGVCQTDTATCYWYLAVSVWHIPVAVCIVLNSCWWTERPSETCRVLSQK
jgi:hypothetical protein